MAKRWQTIINHVYRFKVYLTNWATIRSILSRNILSIKFTADVYRRFKISIHNTLAFKVKVMLRVKRKFISNSKISIGLSAKMRSILGVKCSSNFAVGIKTLLNRKACQKILSTFQIGFATVVLRKRRNAAKKRLAVGFSAISHRKGKLGFDNRKSTIYTVSLLKKLTYRRTEKKERRGNKTGMAYHSTISN